MNESEIIFHFVSPFDGIEFKPMVWAIERLPDTYAILEWDGGNWSTNCFIDDLAEAYSFICGWLEENLPYPQLFAIYETDSHGEWMCNTINIGEWIRDHPQQAAAGFYTVAING